MNTPTPTPRTDSAWAKTFDANGFLSGRGNAASQMRDECATLERELAALTAERDQLRAALALGQQNCDDAYDELRGDADELRADVVRLTAERDQLNEMFHQIRLKLTEASGGPYKLHDEALDDIISERDQLRAAIAEMPTCRCDRSTEQQCELSAKVATLTAERDQLRARAEKAEAAETVALAKWNGALERALKAEAELATERARLRHVALDAAMKGGEK
jgi:chromosome segregation ATPase